MATCSSISEDTSLFHHLLDDRASFSGIGVVEFNYLQKKVLPKWNGNFHSILLQGHINNTNLLIVVVIDENFGIHWLSFEIGSNE